MMALRRVRSVAAVVTLQQQCFLVALAALAVLTACGKNKPNDHNSEPRPRIYNYGDQIGFGFGGDSQRFRAGCDGWAKTEPQFTWTKGLGASLEILVGPSDQPLTLKMKLNGLVSSPKLAFQPVDVSVNGRKLATWKVAALDYYTAVIPADMVRPHEGEANAVGYITRLVLDLYTPKSTAPSDLNTGRDDRRLGICVWEMSITKGITAGPDKVPVSNTPETPEGSSYKYGTPVTFSIGGTSGRYKIGGWYDTESLFTWFGKQPAMLGFRVDHTDHPLTLTARMAALTHPPKLVAQPAEVWVNGQKVAEWQVRSSVDEFSATIPAELANEAGILSIEFTAPKAISPNALGVGADLRQLGIQCHELTISETE